MSYSTERITGTAKTPAMSRASGIPSYIKESLLSDTSIAAECFVNQRFSAKLQAFLVGYTNEMLTNRSFYGS